MNHYFVSKAMQFINDDVRVNNETNIVRTNDTDETCCRSLHEHAPWNRFLSLFLNMNAIGHIVQLQGFLKVEVRENDLYSYWPCSSSGHLEILREPTEDKENGCCGQKIIQG